MSVPAAAATATTVAAVKQNSAELFQKSWNIYKKLVQSNAMSHVEAYAALGSFLKTHYNHNNKNRKKNSNDRSFSFLDLACGDAHFSARTLQDFTNTNVNINYVGIDLSETALALARDNINDFLPSAKKEFILGDFTQYDKLLNNNDDNMEMSLLDVIWIGLSLHHLETDEKVSFMKRVANSLASSSDDDDDNNRGVGGVLLIYEPIISISMSPPPPNHHYQTKTQRQKQEYLEYYYAYFEKVGEKLLADDNNNMIMGPEERRILYDHVRKNDIPESEETWLALGRQAGFSRGEKLFTDPFRLYSLFAYYK